MNTNKKPEIQELSRLLSIRVYPCSFVAHYVLVFFGKVFGAALQRFPYVFSNLLRVL